MCIILLNPLRKEPIMIRRKLIRALALGALSCGGIRVRAQSYPSRPVTLLVGGAPGSVPDLMIRPIAERLSAALGHPFVVENRPGAAGSVAMSALMQSPADGQTLAVATMSQAVFNAYLFAKLPYDPLRDLEPIAPLVSGAMALAAHPSLPGRSRESTSSRFRSRVRHRTSSRCY
jgi:tripartite-type tricarboxylate transporter receptor subunit TctC